MTAMITAAVVVGGVGAATSAYAANKAEDAANAQLSAAQQADAARLAFEQERYDEWKEVYGPMQANLSNYYSQMTPEKYAAASIEEFESQFEKSMTNLETTLMQRGIEDSGIAASLESQSEIAAAETRAGIRNTAEEQMRTEQTNFLQIGLGQNPANNVSQALSSNASSAWNQYGALQNQANAAGQNAGQAIGNLGNLVSEGIYNYNQQN